jgi:hypothetical protein
LPLKTAAFWSALEGIGPDLTPIAIMVPVNYASLGVLCAQERD